MSETSQKQENADSQDEQQAAPKEDAKAQKGDAGAPDSDTKNTKKSQSRSGGEIAKLGEDIEIYTNEPLPAYDFEKIKAYRAVGKGKEVGNFVALVCERHLIPRTRAAVVYERIINPVLLKLVDFGIVYWGSAKKECYVFVYRDPVGKPLLDWKAPAYMGWKQEAVMDIVVKPMVNVLQDFRDKDFFHGAIRPQNLFSADKSSHVKKVFLGDCLSCPASYAQPVLYEPIERAMADPVARGPGTQADDLYAFGVTLAILMRTNDPMEGMSDADIIKHKIDVGSYAAITGKDRFKGSILELLRGLLHDDPGQRWTIDEVLVWLDGRRLSPKQAQRQRKAPRPQTFMGEKYFQIQLLAMDIDLSADETLRIVEEGELAQWLDRSLEDEEAAERVNEAQKVSKEGGGAAYKERLVANLSSALDPMAPIRYKGLRLGGEGIGTALAEVMVLKQDYTPFIELFMQQVAINWITNAQNPNIDVGALVAKYDSCRNYLRQNKIGFGVERCLYMLCPEAHCLSEKLQNYVVTTPEYMMLAFEDMCKKGNAPAFFLDRHSIAFLSSKDPKSIDSYLYDLDSPHEHKKILGNLKCLATIQKRGEIGPFPEIAKAFADMLPIVYKRYHDNKIRNKLKKNVERFAAQGDLVKMAGLLDNAEVQEKDFGAFKEAMHEYAALKKEAGDLQKRLEDKSTFGRVTGKEAAAVVSSLFAAVIILGLAFYFLSSGQTSF